MGILSDLLFMTKPCLPGSSAYSDTDPQDAPESRILDAATAGSFLGWRWISPMAVPAPPLPGNTSDQPAFDALYAFTASDAEDTARFVEFDGFLIDRQTAAACSSLHGPIAA